MLHLIMSDIPEDAPEHCPGTQSEAAGKVSSCQGCPNQSICASGETKGPDPGVVLVKERLANVKYKILVISGKGGVGKSTLTCLLARGLASVPERNVHQSGSGWSPVYVDDNLSIMSVGFLLSSPDDAVIWRGPKKNGLIRQFLSEVDWGQLDFLLVDTPPGTSDEHLSVVQYLKGAEQLSGAVVVTTPQEVALLDVRKEIDFCRKTGVPILGLVPTDMFLASSGGAQKMAEELNVKFLGSLPLDPRLGRSCDDGSHFLAEFADSPAAKSCCGV
ncbi:hypothetical protein B566_EDAN010976 [Ephemera danica]|nr:hypothetical protein B566_EDAN010976 [Ephemera danica]